MKNAKLKLGGVRQICCCVVVVLLVSLPLTAAAGPCPPEGYSRAQLLNNKASDIELLTEQQRNALAIGLLDCLADPDPLLRDGVAYENITKWLREQQLQPETIDSLYQNLMNQVGDSSDPGGFQQPFAALLLSEVARTDRVDPSFTPQRRAEMVQSASSYLSQVNDYRGFSETQGWRHGVAHGSDWVLQLVLNDNINAGQLSVLMAAVASQVSPTGEVFYIYGEPGRLARAVFYTHSRGLLSDGSWQVWLNGIGDPTPFANWNETYSSQAGLAKRHNTLAFLNALFVYAQATQNEQGEALAGQVLAQIQQVM